MATVPEMCAGGGGVGTKDVCGDRGWGCFLRGRSVCCLCLRVRAGFGMEGGGWWIVDCGGGCFRGGMDYVGRYCAGCMDGLLTLRLRHGI